MPGKGARSPTGFALEAHALNQRLHRLGRWYRRYGLVFPAVAVAAFAVDQTSKLIAAAADPRWYVTNPDSSPDAWIVLAVGALVGLLPLRTFAVSAALFVGGGSGNVLDSHIWPGGVPDFIYVEELDAGIWNVADFFIISGAALFAVSLVLLPILGGVRRRRRRRHAAAAASLAMRDWAPEPPRPVTNHGLGPGI